MKDCVEKLVKAIQGPIEDLGSRVGRGIGRCKQGNKEGTRLSLKDSDGGLKLDITYI